MVKRSIMKGSGRVCFRRIFAKAKMSLKSFLLQPSFPIKALRSKEFQMNAKFFASTMLALILVACGGGEVEQTTPQPLAAIPAAAPKVSAPHAAAKPLASVASPFTVDGERVLNYAEALLPNLFVPNSTTTFNYLDVANVRMYSTDWAIAYMTKDVGWYKKDDVLVRGPAGSGSWEVINNVGSMYNFITPTPPTYTLQWGTVTATITKMGNQVVGANQLPAGCTSTLQQCWHDSVANGTVKFLETSAVMTGINTRPIVFAYYVTADGLRWNTLPMYADTGELTGSEINGGSTTNIDMVMGNTPGTVFRVGGNCGQIKWYPSGDPSGNSNVWASGLTTCP